MKNSNVLIGLLGGVAVGAALGLLFAPAKGSETRKKIADKSGDLKYTLKDSVTKFSEKISQTVDNFKSEANEIIADGKTILQEEKANLDNIKIINKSNVL